MSNRLIIDEAYAAPMRDWLQEVKPGSLLILDEAHHAAPSSGANYAIDSKITKAILHDSVATFLIRPSNPTYRRFYTQPPNRLLFSDIMLEFKKRGIPPPMRLCDLNLRPGWSDPEVVRWCMNQADILKVNEEERQFLANLDQGPEGEADRLLLYRYALQGLCTTLGPKGLCWADPLGESLVIPVSREGAPPVVDTVGAGDAITASIAMGSCRKEPSDVFLERGRRWAARICGIPGALPPPTSQRGPAWKS